MPPVSYNTAVINCLSTMVNSAAHLYHFYANLHLCILLANFGRCYSVIQCMY